MGLAHSPKIVTDGLILCLDAANRKSYPGSGTTWNDMSTTSANGTLVNGPTFNNGIITFDGNNDYFETTNRYTSLEFQPNQSFTLSAWFKPVTTTPAGAIISNMVNSSGYPGWDIWFNGSNQLAMHLISSWSLNAIKVRVEYTYTTLASKWTLITCTYNGTSPANPTDSLNSINFYIDGQIYTTNKANDTADGFNTTNETITYDSNQRFRVASRWGSGIATGQSAINVGAVHIYNRMLSAAEIQQNFNALRGRYGI